MITKYLHIYFANSYRTEMLKFKILPTLACKNVIFPIFKLGVQCCSNSLHQIGMFVIVPSRDESRGKLHKNVQKIEF